MLGGRDGTSARCSSTAVGSLKGGQARTTSQLIYRDCIGRGTIFPCRCAPGPRNRFFSIPRGAWDREDERWEGYRTGRIYVQSPKRRLQPPIRPSSRPFAMSLRISHLCKDYPTRSGPLAVLRDVSLELQPGEALAVMGPSGSGKSTLLHILGTLDRPTSGTVRLDGIDPFALPEPELADFRNRHIGFVFQDHHLLPQCTVLENVLIPTLVEPRSEGRRREMGTDLLERVGLSGRLDHRPGRAVRRRTAARGGGAGAGASAGAAAGRRADRQPRPPHGPDGRPDCCSTCTSRSRRSWWW